MEQTNLRFLSALRAALHGEKADMEALSREEWALLLRVAEIHKVLPMIFEAVHACPSLENLGGEALELLRRMVRRQVMVQTLRTEEYLTLNRELRDRGISPLVVKGLVCRELYPKPDHRLSGDEDVLIPPEQFARCCELLGELGLERMAEKPETYEISFRKPGSTLYIELHRHLFLLESDDLGNLNPLFEGVFDRAVELTLRGSRVNTMAPTDHMFYLICHAFKHFLHSGFGIRQVCDMALFGQKYGGQVDWQQVLRNCEAIRATKFAAAVFRIGEKHLGIPIPEAFRELEVDEKPMLLDLLAGGLYGDANLSRRHSNNITMEAIVAQRQGKRPRGVLTSSVFPPAEKLAERYPYLKEKPYLLPLAWGQRLLRYSRETRENGDSSAAESLKIGAERLALMKQYGILD